MCGIIGVLSQEGVQKKILKGLRLLDYRGYDSAGIAVLSGGRIVVNKHIGTIDKLEGSIKDFVCSGCGIGHTRWATHGAPSVRNCHPHLSCDKSWAVVHNGIIENYQELKKHLKKQGITLNSNTDSEVIPNLLQLKKEVSIGTLIEVCTKLKGSYALACINKEHPDELFLAKLNSPLFVAVCGGDILVSSDTTPFMGKTTGFYHMHNGEFAHVRGENITFYNRNGKIIFKEIKPLEVIDKSADKDKYSHFMIKEIFEVPHLLKVVARFYLSNKELIYDFKNLFEKAQNIFLIGCGTAYHAGLMAEQYFKKYTDKNIYTAVASEFVYSNTKINKGDVCIFISQSGETADTIAVQGVCQQRGGVCVALTNNLNSHLAYLCDYVWPVLAGAEIAVASTKAYSCQCMALMILSLLAGGKSITMPQVSKLAIQLQNINILELKTLVKTINKAGTIFFVGRGLDFVTALEGALKLKEISYINCWGISSGELKHGTLALVDSNSVVFNIITQKETKQKSINAIYELKARGAKVVVISHFEDIRQICGVGDVFIKLQPVNQIFYPLLSIAPLQLLSYFVSVSKGINPDKPRNLAKSVTVE
ncbi:MAG: glutamine--fructose-6-phosphate transaminase (isomerizing) [Christensenellaceae bacterium]|jgi:glucosamine--fructose-6-phosphate aminotransferase (isomerizing)|nr:glutamine--fructose-6-phosphate transaminase (isomerizing) [Christensenellaceae bacterium]